MQPELVRGVAVSAKIFNVQAALVKYYESVYGMASITSRPAGGRKIALSLLPVT